jgi:hypothetical protein
MQSPYQLHTVHDVVQEWSLDGMVVHQYRGNNKLHIDNPRLKRVQSTTMTEAW